MVNVVESAETGRKRLKTDNHAVAMLPSKARYSRSVFTADPSKLWEIAMTTTGIRFKTNIYSAAQLYYHLVQQFSEFKFSNPSSGAQLHTRSVHQGQKTLQAGLGLKSKVALNKRTSITREVHAAHSTTSETKNPKLYIYVLDYERQILEHFVGQSLQCSDTARGFVDVSTFMDALQGRLPHSTEEARVYGIARAADWVFHVVTHHGMPSGIPSIQIPKRT